MKRDRLQVQHSARPGCSELRALRLERRLRRELRGRADRQDRVLRRGGRQVLPGQLQRLQQPALGEHQQQQLRRSQLERFEQLQRRRVAVRRRLLRHGSSVWLGIPVLQ